MALIDFFLTQSVMIRPFLRMADGEQVYGAVETRKCRFERGSNLTTVYKNPDGQIEQLQANAKLFCTGSAIPDKSVVSFGGVDYTVIKCRVMNGFSDHHLEVYLE